MNANWGILICILLLGINSAAQTDTSAIDIETLTERISSIEQNETEENELYFLLEELLRNPVDLNKADILDLQVIPFMHPEYAGAIVDHRKKYGRFFSKAELYSVSSLPVEIINAIQNFVTVSEYRGLNSDSKIIKVSKRLYSLNLRSRLQNDLQDKKGFKTSKYSGNPLKVYNRLIINFNNFSAGLLTEKDPGENSIHDFSSFNINLKNTFLFEEIVAGDYNVEFGQGLAAWNGYASMKNADAIFIRNKKEISISPYRSAQENHYFRGIAAKMPLWNFNLLLFYSNNKFDARIDSSGVITSVPVDGYHRTNNEMTLKNSSSQITGGAGAGISFKETLLMNVIFMSSFLDHKRVISGAVKKDFKITSLSYNFFSDILNIYGETAYDGTTAATINSMYIPFDRNLKMVTSFRFYPKGFISLSGNPFAEQSNPFSGETGFYSSINFRAKSGEFNIYFDQFVLGGSAFPLQGNEIFFSYKIKIKPAEICLTFKNKKKEEIDVNKKISNNLRQSYSFEFKYDLNKGFKTKAKIQYRKVLSNDFNKTHEGYLFLQDFNYTIKDIQLCSRLILFRTDSFESAVYEYENDLPGIFQCHSLYGEGTRWYFLVRYRLFNFISVSLKYSETYKPKEKFIGTGDSMIYNNIDNQIGLQAEINL